jgi:periplasmic protein TonB
MHKYFILLILLFVEQFVFAQTDTTGDAVFKVEKPSIDSALIFTFVEQQPEYPGGNGEMLKFIQRNLRYPQMEQDNKIAGMVLLRFIVEADGSVSNVTVIRGASPGLNKEAVRVVKLLGGFAPGRQQGKPVRVYYNLPIEFKL